MSNKYVGVAAIFIAAAVLFSCQKSTPLGSELLEDDNTEVLFTDSIPIQATITKEDSIDMYVPGEVLLSNLLLGDMTDPIFGRYRSEMALQLSLESSSNPDMFENAVLDSVVLSVAYDSAVGIYGRESALHSIAVYQLAEDLSTDSSYYSDRQFQTEMTPIGQVDNFTPDLLSKVGVIEPGGESPDTTLYDPHFRIKLDDAFGEMLIQADTNVYTSDSSFVEFFKGIVLRPTMQTESILPIDVANPITRITVYYTQDDTLHRDFFLEMEDPRVRFSNFDNFDYAGTIVEPFIDDPVKADSLLFVQSNAGLDVRLDFPDLSELEGKLINHAAFELVIAELPQDDPQIYDPIEQLILTIRDDEGTLVWIDDVTFAVNRGNLIIFGGQPETKNINGSQKQVVQMNLSDYFQRIVDGDVEPTLYISTLFDRTRVARSVFYGPGHSEFPARLKVTYSLPQ